MTEQQRLHIDEKVRTCDENLYKGFFRKLQRKTWVQGILDLVIYTKNRMQFQINATKYSHF